jgi:hypothetical protein
MAVIKRSYSNQSGIVRFAPIRSAAGGLRKPVQMVNQVLYPVKLELIKNPGKTFFERVAGVLAFLKYYLTPGAVVVSVPVADQLCAGIGRFAEHRTILLRVGLDGQKPV